MKLTYEQRDAASGRGSIKTGKWTGAVLPYVIASSLGMELLPLLYPMDGEGGGGGGGGYFPECWLHLEPLMLHQFTSRTRRKAPKNLFYSQFQSKRNPGTASQ